MYESQIQMCREAIEHALETGNALLTEIATEQLAIWVQLNQVDVTVRSVKS